jgi:hypothetical protein
MYIASIDKHHGSISTINPCVPCLHTSLHYSSARSNEDSVYILHVSTQYLHTPIDYKVSVCTKLIALNTALALRPQLLFSVHSFSISQPGAMLHEL